MNSLELAQPKFDIESMKESFSVVKELRKQRDDKNQEIEEIREIERKVIKSLISLRHNVFIARSNKDPKKIEAAEAKLAEAEKTLEGLQDMRQELSIPVTGLNETIKAQSTEVIKKVPGIDHSKVCEVSLRVMSALHELMELHKQVSETKDLYQMATGDSLDLSLFNGGDSWNMRCYPEKILAELSGILSRNFYLNYLTPDQAAMVAKFKENY